MSAADHLHPGQIPGQMKLFMGGQEFQDTVTHSSDFAGNSSNPEWAGKWAKKLAQSKVPHDDSWPGEGRRPHGAGVYDSMLEHGYQADRVGKYDGMPTITHNTAGGFTQTQGHHRVAAAAEIERTTGRNVWLPVNYGHGPMYVYPSDAKRINVSEV